MLAALTNGAAVAFGGNHLAITSPILLVWIAGFFGLSLLLEILLHLVTGREVSTQTP